MILKRMKKILVSNKNDSITTATMQQDKESVKENKTKQGVRVYERKSYNEARLLQYLREAEKNKPGSIQKKALSIIVNEKGNNEE